MGCTSTKSTFADVIELNTTQSNIPVTRKDTKGPKSFFYNKEEEENEEEEQEYTESPKEKKNTEKKTLKEKLEENKIIRSNKKFKTNYFRTSSLKKIKQITGVGNNENEEKNGKHHGSVNFIRNRSRRTTLLCKEKLNLIISNEQKNLPVFTENLVKQQTGLPTQKYKILKKLGSGAFGKVYKAYNLKTKNIVAMKVIHKISENEVEDIELKNEIDILKKFSHPDIVKIFEFYDIGTEYYLITEYCQYGELFSYIKYDFTEKQLAVIFYQIFSGLYYLHLNHICHRDLKLENIMINEKEHDIKTDEEYFWIKIIDLGAAKIYEKNKNEKVVIGSSYYIAPEVLKQNYNEKCDIWSVGVLLFMALTGKAPFNGNNDEEIISEVKTGIFNKNNVIFLESSEEVKDLICKLIEPDVDKRLSAFEALKHPWFKKYNGRALFENFEYEDIVEYINNLLNFKSGNKIRDYVMAFLVHNLPLSEDSTMILKVFRYFNTSGTCLLLKEELQNGLELFFENINSDEINKNFDIDELFLILDLNNQGYIEFEEFLRACIDKKYLLTKRNLKYAFKFIDKDKSKLINVEKIMNAFEIEGNKFTEAAFNSILIQVDKDGDGYINFKEFEELML